MRPPGLSVAANRPETLWERSRWEWRLGDPGDPAALVEDFLAGHGFPVRSLTAAAAADGPVGASLFVSAAAGARMIGAPTGPASPCPAVPDLVAVVWQATGLPAGEPTGPGGGGQWRLGPWQPSWSPARHAAAVDQVRAAIGRGDVYQVNLVGHASARYRGDPVPALRRLAGLPGASYGTVLTGAGWAIGCGSPELLVRVRDGQVRTAPIKGTRPATDRGLAQLRSSAKERAEHVMIVDLARNDLGRIARTGTVRVEELYAVRRWCDLWQAESVVTASLAPRVGLAALLRALCPPASVTGAPKPAALAQIAALEPVGRGAAMGALGWIGPDGIELGLSIRTVAADARRLHLWAGGGITWSSRAAAEVAEAAAKAAPLRRALGAGQVS